MTLYIVEIAKNLLPAVATEFQSIPPVLARINSVMVAVAAIAIAVGSIIAHVGLASRLVVVGWLSGGQLVFSQLRRRLIPRRLSPQPLGFVHQ